MVLAFAPDASHPMVDTLLRTRIPRAAGLNRAIDERDDMLDFAIGLFEQDRDRALTNYFQNGLEQFELVRHIGSWRGRVGRMLDFASGYGRLTRFLVHESFCDELTVSDILADGMSFQHEQFGVKTIVSTTLPENFPAESRYDFIFVASLFTHLPPATFTSWLRRLYGLLEPQGLLVFSVHDERIAPVKVEGIHFATNSESRVLDGSEYGSTWVTEPYVRGQIAAIDAGAACVRLPRALSDWQDVYVVSPQPIRDPRPRIVPKGFLDTFVRGEKGIRVAGWASSVDEPVERVELRVGERVVASTQQFGPRPDVAAWLGTDSALHSGWAIEVPYAQLPSFRYDVVTISAFGASGAERILFLGSLESLNTQVVEGKVKELESQLAARDAEIAGMKATRWWKAHERWVAFKGSLGR